MRVIVIRNDEGAYWARDEHAEGVEENALFGADGHWVTDVLDAYSFPNVAVAQMSVTPSQGERVVMVEVT